MNSLVEEYFLNSSSSSSSSSDEDEDDFLLDDDDFDEVALMLVAMEEKINKQAKHGGSQPGRVQIQRGRVTGHMQLVRDYFAEDPVYLHALFRRRFRMSTNLFIWIVTAVEARNDYFKQKRNAAGEVGFSALQKITAVMRVIAYGIPADYADEYLRIGEDTTIRSVRKFTKTVIKVFREQYLRAPNTEDTARLKAMSEARGFPGMLGCIDCMHWKWKNCPTAWHGQFTRHCHNPTIILEAVASQDLWIWHCYFGMPGAHNDINVLQRSHLFARLAAGDASPCDFKVNGHDYNMGYYLADGIYPAWSIFVKTISNPQGNKIIHFTKAQEAVRKDIERAFGVLQARFAIVRGPARFWDEKTLWRIMTSCVIMHNMIIENECGQVVDFEYDYMGTPVEPLRTDVEQLQRFLEVHQKIEDRQSHEKLCHDLVEHLWQLHGQ